jgi:S-adenosylmethionine decarboxylase proenzyme
VESYMLKIKQLLIDAYGCDADLDDQDFLIEALEAATTEVGAKIVRRMTQRFSPVGVSAILILAETHMSIHTWPEHSYAAVDIFICGEGKDPHKAWEILIDRLKPESYEMNELVRTIGGKRSKDN